MMPTDKPIARLALLALALCLAALACKKDEMPDPPTGGGGGGTPPDTSMQGGGGGTAALSLALADFDFEPLYPPSLRGVSALTEVGGRALACADGGVYVSLDAGDTWQRRYTVSGDWSRARFTRVPGGRVLAWSPGGTVVASDDEGLSWSTVPAAGLAAAIDLSLVAATDGDVFAFSGGTAADAPRAYRSTDGGRTFARLPDPPADRYGLTAVALPAGALLLTEGTRVWRSEDDGQTWRDAGLEVAEPVLGLWADPATGAIAARYGTGVGTRLRWVDDAGAERVFEADLRLIARLPDGTPVAEGRYSTQYRGGEGPGEAGETLWRWAGDGPGWLPMGTPPTGTRDLVTVAGRRLAAVAGMVGVLDEGAAQWRFDGLLGALDFDLVGYRKAVIAAGRVWVSPDEGATWYVGRGFSTQDRPSSVAIDQRNGDLWVGTEGQVGKLWRLDINGAGTQNVIAVAQNGYGVVDVSPGAKPGLIYFAVTQRGGFDGFVGVRKVGDQIDLYDATGAQGLGRVYFADELPARAGYAVVHRRGAFGGLQEATFSADDERLGSYQEITARLFPQDLDPVASARVDNGVLYRTTTGYALAGPDTIHAYAHPDLPGSPGKLWRDAEGRTVFAANLSRASLRVVQVE